MSSRLTGADAFWLQADSPTNRMVVSGFLALDGRLHLDELKARLLPRLLQLPPFRSSVLVEGGEPRWIEGSSFDPDRHFHEVHLPPESKEEALMHLFGRLASEALPLDQPLWCFVLVQGLAEGSVVVPRVHHCLADGIALVAVLMTLTEPLESPRDPVSEVKPALPWDPLHWARDQVGRTQNLVHRGWRFVEHLGPHAMSAKGQELKDAVVKLALMSPQDHPAFKGRLGVEKRVAWSSPLDLAPMKAMAHKADGKVNDVLLALVSGALRRFTEARGTPFHPGEPLRATVPVNLRPLEEAHHLGNCFGLVFVNLPVTTASVEARLEDIKQQMDVLKTSTEPLLTFGLMRAMGWGPPELEAQFIDLFSRRTSIVLSNVPGPRQRVVFAGRPLRRLMFWVPQSGSVSLGLSLISYAGELMLGVKADRGLLPDAPALAVALREEYEHMADALRI